MPAEDTVAGLRDRAILSVGLQVGLRRAEIAALKVGDLHQNRGYDSLRVMRKGGRRDALAINPQTAARTMLVAVDDPVTGPLRLAGNPMKVSGFADPPSRAPAPDLDADRDHILRELGL